MELKNILLLIVVLIFVIILVVILSFAYFAWTVGYDLFNLLQNIIGGNIDPLDILNYFFNQDTVNPEDVLKYVNQSNVTSDDIINYVNQSG